MSETRYVVPWDRWVTRQHRLVIALPTSSDEPLSYDVAVSRLWDGCVTVAGNVPFRLECRAEDGAWMDVE